MSLRSEVAADAVARKQACSEAMLLGSDCDARKRCRTEVMLLGSRNLGNEMLGCTVCVLEQDRA